jgi:uncharacterized protein with PIN domain
MLGTLTTYLRFAGHDTAYTLEDGAEADEDVLALAERENRRLVTRDRDLAARAPESYLLTERDVTEQLAELAAQGLEFSVPAEPVRCGSCNGQLERVDAGEPTPEYAPTASAEGVGGSDSDSDGFRVWRCVDCGQHFWKGSHWERMAETLAGL